MKPTQPLTSAEPNTSLEDEVGRVKITESPEAVDLAGALSAEGSAQFESSKRPNAGAGRDQKTLLLAGGGSGGHISPGIAIVERLVELELPIQCQWACSQRSIDDQMLSAASLEHKPIPASHVSVRPAGMLRFVRSIRPAVRAAGQTLDEHRIDRVLTLGGFVAPPVVLAARRRGIPVTLLNLDDPPGKANRLIARWCDDVWSATALPASRSISTDFVGLPIRHAALAPGDRSTCRRALGLDIDRPALLITGASQGATSINRFVLALLESDPLLFEGWQVIHLTGEAMQPEVEQAYHRASVPAVVIPFLEHMGLAWGAAEAAISRAGANSVAEVAANAVPTLFLPYPHHRDQHQRRNAQPLVDADAALVGEDRVEPRANCVSLAKLVHCLLTDERLRHTMKQSLERVRPQDAATRIARRIASLMFDE